MSITPNLLAISAQFLLRCAFAAIATILAHVGPSFAPVGINFATVATNLARVGANFMTVCAQFTPLAFVDASLRCRRAG
jgi:hypothetical protein